ncbi:hypothetical protein M378DRAFT_182687, partial [Amanita muscaria Koide BX008]
MHCPQCHRKCKDKKTLLSHMNQPLGSCLSHSEKVVNLAEELENHKMYRRQHPSQQWSTPSEDERHGSRPPSEPVVPESMDVDEVECNNMVVDDDMSPSHNGHFVEEYDGAAKTYGSGTSFMRQFNSDTFATERAENIYYPFASRAEWDLAAFLLRSDLSIAAIDNFLSLTL